MRFLIVEDEQVSLKLLDLMLEDLGERDDATNGMQAVELFQQAVETQRNYNIVFMDINMPLMDGHEALRTIRKIEKDHKVPKDKQAKVVMVTAMADDSNVVEAFSEGCEYYLVKPYSIENIYELLKQMGCDVSSQNSVNK